MLGGVSAPPYRLEASGARVTVLRLVQLGDVAFPVLTDSNQAVATGKAGDTRGVGVVVGVYRAVALVEVISDSTRVYRVLVHADFHNSLAVVLVDNLGGGGGENLSEHRFSLCETWWLGLVPCRVTPLWHTPTMSRNSRRTPYCFGWSKREYNCFYWSWRACSSQNKTPLRQTKTPPIMAGAGRLFSGRGALRC